MKALQRLCHRAKAPPSGGAWRAWDARLCTLLEQYQERADDAGRLARRLVREMAAQVLRQLGDARAVEPLVRLATEDTYCAQTSIIALQRIIECAAAKLAPKDLRTIAHLEGVVQWRYGGGCQESYEDAVDCSHVRQLARQELIRRGLEA